MKEIKVREIYTVDTISKTNDKAWEKIKSIMEDDGEDYMFDFRGIELDDPWLNNQFNKFMADERVHIKLYSAEKTAYTVNTMCILGGLKSGRATNEDIVTSNRITPKEKRTIGIANELQEHFEVEAGKAIFKVYNRYHQIESVDSVDYIKKAIEIYKDKNDSIDIVIDTKDILIQKNVIELLIATIDGIADDGTNIEIRSDDEETKKTIEMFRHVKNNKKYTVEEKLKRFSGIEPGTVGLISKYRKSRGLDEFGRQGKGEVVSCRVAIFDGIEQGELKFTAFNGDTLYTAQHWLMENDNDESAGLEKINIKAKIEEVGLHGDFLGSIYHFMEPIQYNIDGYSQVYRAGQLKTEKLTIPERIKEVLNDWKISYNREHLDICIEETNKILG